MSKKWEGAQKSPSQIIQYGMEYEDSNLWNLVVFPQFSGPNAIWLVVYLPLWKMMDFVSWDDEIPNWMGKS